MVVTEVKIKLVPNSNDKLLAFASITFDRCFVVRDIKIIQGSSSLFVAMPSRKITDRCTRCGCKNHLQALYCNQCGGRLPENRMRVDARGRARLHADIAHPINGRCRQAIQDSILKEYQAEVERSRLPGYVPQSFDDFDAGPDDGGELEHAESQPPLIAPTAAVPGNVQPQANAKPAENKPADNSGFGVFA